MSTTISRSSERVAHMPNIFRKVSLWECKTSDPNRHKVLINITLNTNLPMSIWTAGDRSDMEQVRAFTAQTQPLQQSVDGDEGMSSVS